MFKLLKVPLLIAALVIVARLVLEMLGAPLAVTNLVSLVILFLVIFPIYFALVIARSGAPHPFRTLFKYVLVYAVLARAMVIPTYWLAYIFQWTAPRFAVSNGGVVGPGVPPLNGFLIIPLAALIGWVIGALIIGGALGSVVLALKRKPVLGTPDRSQI